MQPASAGAYPLATLGPKLRSCVGLQHFADRVDLPHLVYELLPEPAAVRISIAQLSQGYVGTTALQRVEEQRRCPGDGVCQLRSQPPREWRYPCTTELGRPIEFCAGQPIHYSADHHSTQHFIRQENLINYRRPRDGSRSRSDSLQGIPGWELAESFSGRCASACGIFLEGLF